MRLFYAAAVTAAALFASLPAQAAAIFDLTGPFIAHFVLPTSPTDIVPEELDDPTIFGMSGFADVNGVTHPIHFHFYTEDAGGGLDFLIEDTLDLYSPGFGPSVFTGGVFTPTFLAGSYEYEDYYIPGLKYSLTITITPDGAVPEPATWAMMIGGFALAGAAMRRRRTSARFA